MGSRDMLARPGSDKPKIETPGKKSERLTSANESKRFEKKKKRSTVLWRDILIYVSLTWFPIM